MLPQLYEREAEYLCRVEFARTAEDILWRRTRLGLHAGPDAIERLGTWLANRDSRETQPGHRHLESAS